MRKATMNKQCFDELLNRTGLTRRDLAKKMKLSENLVYQWYSKSPASIRRRPTGPAAVLLKLWLQAARWEEWRVQNF